MKQTVLKGNDIFAEISTNLKNAKKEILVVSAWFTDQDLLDILIEKAKQGLNIKVIVAENKDNEKLDFTALTKVGGKLTLANKKGYGMLHEKYCIIDNKRAFHGSYNWTNNAKKNNSESVIFTDHKETIHQLINDFKKMEATIKTVEDPSGKNGSILTNLLKKLKIKTLNPKNEQDVIETETSNGESKDNMDKIFDSIIAAEVTQTDENSVKERGRKLAIEVGGDHNTLPNAMNSLYHLYISDNNSNKEKKETLVKKIDHKAEEFVLKVDTEKNQKMASQKISAAAKKNDLELHKSKLESDKTVIELENKISKDEVIPELKSRVNDLETKKSEMKINFVKPSFKWHEFIPLSIFFIGLCGLMFLFYSSSAYIMLYSIEDAKIAISNGIDINPQVFEEGAIRKAFSKSNYAGAYVLLFVFIPLVIGYTIHKGGEKLKSSWVSNLLMYLIIFLIDAFIAIKVTSTINEINFLTGLSVNETYGLADYFTDINFYLVFFLGAIPFIFLALLMNSIIKFFVERTPEVEEKRVKLELSQLGDKIEKTKNEIAAENFKCQENSVKILDLTNQINEFDQKLIYLPEEADQETSVLISSADNQKALIKNKASMYKDNIENDTIKISVTALLNRISAFLEGWDEWLHSQFSFQIATTTSQASRDEVDAWLKNNIKSLEN